MGKETKKKEIEAGMAVCKEMLIPLLFLNESLEYWNVQINVVA